MNGLARPPAPPRPSRRFTILSVTGELDQLRCALNGADPDLSRFRTGNFTVDNEAAHRRDIPLACPPGIASNAVAQASNRAERPDRAMERGKERKGAK